MRPLGGWVLGRYADRSGRKAALTLSVMLMCLGSLIIAFAPAYATDRRSRRRSLLVFARLLQGFSVGGEYGTSATYMSEITPAHQRGFYSGVLYVTLVMGQLLALGVLLVLQWFFLSHDQLEAWGWRIPFVIGAVAALGGLYLRRNLPETQTFQKHQASGGRCRRSSSAAAAPARSADRDRPDGGRHALLLRLHDVHPAVPREHRRTVEDRRDDSSRRHRCSCSC